MALALEPIAAEPLPGKRLARVIARADSAFVLSEGLSDALVAELVARSADESDEELAKNTSDRERFASAEAYDAWLSKERYPYALSDAEGRLAALIWYGPEVTPDGREGDTIAFRSYPPYRGTGIMGDLSRFVLARHGELREGRMLWLATNEDNAGGIRLYEKLGFVRTGEHEGRVIMEAK